MKKIVILNGSYEKYGHTHFFIKKILSKLPKNKYEFSWIFLQDYSLEPLIKGIRHDTSYMNITKNKHDDIYKIQKKVLLSDLFVIASPVYDHNISATLKFFLDKCSTWAHTLRLFGKPTVVLSTCQSNGFDTVTDYLCDIITHMGGNIIANANAATLNQLFNKKWLDSVCTEISKRIIKYSNLPPTSNKWLERYYQATKYFIKLRSKIEEKEYPEKTDEEVNFWKKRGMIPKKTFEDCISK